MLVLFADGPSVVKLMLKRRHLSAGKSHQIKCEAIGAKPQATISWWVGGKQVKPYLTHFQTFRFKQVSAETCKK